MFSPQTAAHLRERGCDAFHVAEIGLQATADAVVAAAARAAGRGLVTENVADFAAEPDLVLIFVRKRNLPPGGAQPAALADALERWRRENPDPYLGAHWPHI